MGHTTLSKTLRGLIPLLTASSLFAVDALVDDHTDGTNANDFEAYWYYYDDNSGVKEDDRPQKAPTSTPSVISVDFVEKNREAFGNTGDTWKVKEYTFKVGDEAGNKFATMPFKYGEIWEASYGDATPYVGVGTMLAVDGKSIDLTGATAVSFKLRSHTADLVVDFKVETMDITEDSTYAYYQTGVSATTSWTEMTVLLDDLEQPGWTPATAEKAFDITKVTKLAWEVAGGKNKNITEDGLDVDDIKIIDYTFISPTVYLPTATLGSAGTGLFASFEGDVPQSSPINTYWYAYDDHEIGGTSAVTAGATKNTTTGLLNLEWVDGSGVGNAGRGCFLEMALGPTIQQTKPDNTVVDVQGFVGIGVNLYDSTTATYFDATTGKRGTKGAESGSATGIYFEYLADGDYKYMTLELNDMSDVGDSQDPTRKNMRGEGIVYYRNFLKTGTEWKAVSIPFTDLIIHDDWEGYTAIPLDLTKLAKLQFKVQGAEGQAGILQIDNVGFPGLNGFSVGVAGQAVARRTGNAAISAAYRGGNVLVNWNNTKLASGRVNLVNTKGAVVRSVAVSSDNASLSAGHLPAGMYFVKLSGSDVSGKTVNRQTAFTVVK